MAILVSSLLLLAFLGGFFEIAFIGLEYESLVPMIGIGVMTFASPPTQRARMTAGQSAELRATR
jgi:hypothetical protein